MSKGTRTAAKSSAQELLASKGTPAGLDDFLSGYTANASSSSHKDESSLVVHLKMMSKSSDITKQKSLREINALLSSLDDATVVNYVPNLVNIILKHSHYSNPVIRAGVYAALHTLMKKGKSVKQAIAPELPGLAGPWLMAMQDSELSIQQEATDAFQAAFTPEKRVVMLLKYNDDILSYTTLKIKDITDASMAKTLTDGETDGFINALYSALRAMGYLIKQVSASQAAVIAFLETPVLQKLIPQSGKGSGKGKLVLSSPPVRAGVLTLLRDVVTYCPSTPTLHQLVARALDGSIMDLNVFTAKRVWELLLFWCRTGGASIISYFPPRFLDTIVDTIMKCRSEELAEIIFPSLFPLLTQLSKDSRCVGVMDEFCGALIEKIHLHIDTPTLSSKELAVVSKALMSCWELHTVRKANSNGSNESLELFTVIVLNFTELLAALSKHQRYLEAVGVAVASSLLKTLIRSEEFFKECTRVLFATKDAAFVVFPQDSETSASPSLPSKDGYEALQNAVVGLICQLMLLESTYSRWIPMLGGYFRVLMQRRIDAGDVIGAAMGLHYAGPDYRPTDDTVEFLEEHLITVFQEWSSNDKKKLNVQSDILQAYESLLQAVLRWRENSTDPRFAALLLSVEVLKGFPTVQSCVQKYKMQDSAKLINMLFLACDNSRFDDIDLYVRHIKANGALSLEPYEQQGVLKAVQSSIQKEFKLLDTSKDVCVENKNEATRHLTSEENGTDDLSVESSSCSDSQSGKGSKKGKSKDALGGRGNTVFSYLLKWCSILDPTEANSLGALLTEVHDHFFPLVGEQMLLLLCAIAPCVYPEYYLSMKALRVALEDTDDDLADAIEAKSHFVSTQQFQEVSDRIQELLVQFGASMDTVDHWCNTFWNRLLEGDSEEEEPYPIALLAAQKLQQLLPLASPSLIARLVSSEEVWDEFRVLPIESDDVPCLFDGHFSIVHMNISLYTAVRSGQMIRLMDYCISHSILPDSSNALKDDEDAKQRATRIFVLLRSSMTQELFSSTICLQLYKLLQMMLVHLTFPVAVAHLAHLITESEEETRDQIICTFASVVRAIAPKLDPTEKVSFAEVVTALVSHLTEFIMTKTFSRSGAVGISTSQLNYYMIFFQLLDQAADVLRMDLLSSVSVDLLTLFNDFFCQLTMYDCSTVKMSLILHRHLATKPEMHDSTVKALTRYAQQQSIMDSWEVLAELSCCRIVDQVAFGELVRSILHFMCRCYSLKHLPTNGRLMKASQGSNYANFKYLRRVVLASITARKGVVVHSRMDDVLRGSVNLVIFDAVCECVSHLRTTNKKEVTLLVRLIASTVEYLNALLPEDVGVLRASESSTHTITSMFVFAYLWLSATPVQKLEAIGIDIVASVMRAACQLANLTLVKSSISLVSQLEPIITKLPTKPLRNKFSSAEPVKLQVFRRQNTLLRKTHKHKLALFPYLLSWGAYLTNSEQSEEWALQLNRANICMLMDLIVTLMLSPVVPGSSRMEDTYISVSLGDEDQSTGAIIRNASLSALTHPDATDVMSNLAQGSDALFRLLLSGRTLSLVKDWMDTVEKRVQDLLFTFVRLYISKPLVQQALQEVLAHGKDGKTTFSMGESMTVGVNTSSSNVTLEYEVEGEQLVVRISFPSDFPLFPPKVEFRDEKEYGVSWKTWRGWMMRMTGKLFGGGPSVWDCIVLFQRNVCAHFEGMEPCPICFAIVSAVDNRLPEKVCSVCRNSKFHGSCLYTWWANGGSNVCPLCRSPWVA